LDRRLHLPRAGDLLPVAHRPRPCPAERPAAGQRRPGRARGQPPARDGRCPDRRGQALRQHRLCPQQPDRPARRRQCRAGRRLAARPGVVTDRATFAYLVDVYVLEAYRGCGLGRWLVSTILAHPELQGLRRWMLATRDARDYYRPLGFSDLAHPDWLMEMV